MLTFETRLLPFKEDGSLSLALGALANQQPVIFPTDTVYGIGVQPEQGVAIERLYAAKGRPSEKGIPVLVSDLGDLEKIVTHVPERAESWGAQFWPGPLTIILPKRAHLPPQISPNAGIAVRIPDHNQTRRLIRQAGGALATTSANRSGSPPAQNAQEAYGQLKGTVPYILDGGQVDGGVASTIVSLLEEEPVIIRTGPISAADLELA
ncbi:MAG: L-threonylcarbamoyladenylate synthase [Chloroflexota bacterium]